jgi:alanyl-tRNA synthetase
MGHAFPELKKNPQHVAGLIREEEVSFGRTLDRGIALFENAVEQSGKQIGADDAFKLHDTYGFPIDLTRIMAEERGMTVDVAGYEKLMEEARERARAGGKADGQSRLGELPPAVLNQLGEAGVSATDDAPKFEHAPVDARVMAIWNGDDLGLSPASVYEDEELAVILDRTNFYAEMGGQVGDRGTLRAKDLVFDVTATRAVGGYVLHIGRIISGRIRAGDLLTATVHPGRLQTERNHTTTHLANWALREVFGEGVQQKGSMVDAEKLRFDFSYPTAMTEAELARVETLVNELVAKNLPVHTATVPQEKAMKIHGLRAVFGEKYPPMVRVVSIGVPVEKLIEEPENPQWRGTSIEFCGGTHLPATGKAEAFAVMTEESVSKGIRRIAAVTGEAAKVALSAGEALIRETELIAGGNDEQLGAGITALQKKLAEANVPLRARRAVHATIAQLQARFKAWEKNAKKSGGGVDAIAAAQGLLAESADVANGKLIVGSIDGAGEEQLRQAMDWLKKKAGGPYAVLLASASAEKISFVAAVSDELVARGLKAGDWIKAAAAVAGGSGGGRPQMAQGSGKDPAKLDAALEEARKFAEKAIG